MYRLHRRFSLFALIACLGMVSGAYGASSVSVLGSGSTGYTTGTKTSTAAKAVGVNKGKTTSASVLNANSGVKKSASVKTISPKTTANLMPISRAASNRIGAIGTKTAKTGADGARFPGVVTKTNVQNLSKTSGSALKPVSGGAGYNMQEMTDKIGSIEETLSNKVDSVSMNDYYTKSEIDANNYTRDEIDAKLAGIDTSASSQYIRYLSQKVDLHDAQIQELLATDQAVYDLNSQEKKNLYFVTDFDAEAVLGITE